MSGAQNVKTGNQTETKKLYCKPDARSGIWEVKETIRMYIPCQGTGNANEEAEGYIIEQDGKRIVVLLSAVEILPN